jgi:hypothetical protein
MNGQNADSPFPISIILMKRLFTITDHYVGQRLTVRVDGKLMLTPLALALTVVVRDQRFARSGASAAVPCLLDADLRAVKGHSSAPPTCLASL